MDFLKIVLHVCSDEKNVLNFFRFFKIKAECLLLSNEKYVNDWVVWGRNSLNPVIVRDATFF